MIGTVVGSYEVLARLGGGGVAEVYRVRHTVLGTFHALKVLKAPSEKARARLVAEGRIQATLRHPNIVAVRDVLAVEGAPALLLDLVDGPTLGALVAHGVRRPDLVDALGHGVLLGVAAAHEAGLVHRDLKPGNVLVELGDDGLVPRVTDFGLARGDGDDGERLTATGATLGTPLYMAPEQVRDARSADQRSDVWALGVLLYELITGEPPFAGTDRLELYQAIDRAEVPDLTERAPHAPARWRAAVAAALQRDPSARPADAGALAALWGPPEGPAAVDEPLRALLATLAPTAVSVADEASATWGDNLDLGATPVTEHPQDTPVTMVPERPPASVATTHEQALAPVGRSPLGSLPDEPATASVPAWRTPALLVAAVLATGITSTAGTIWWLGRAPAPVAVVAPVPQQPAPPQAPVQEVPAVPAVPADPREAHRVAFATKALEKLLDGHAGAAARDADMVVAGSASELPELVLSAGGAVDGSRYSALYEIGRGREWLEESLASHLLNGMVDPARADQALAEVRGAELVPATVVRLLMLPLSDDRAVDAALDRLDDAAPDRRLPALVRSRVRRRQGDARGAAAALAAAHDLGETTPSWEVEEALVEAAQGDLAGARARLEALSLDRRSPTVAHSAYARVAGLQGDHLAVATGLEVVAGGLFGFAQVRWSLADAAWRRGERAEALELLAAIEDRLGANPDDMVGWFRVENATEQARLGAAAGDEAALQQAVATLRALGATERSVVGWGQAETLRRRQAAEALLAAVRGRSARVGEAREQLEASGRGPVSVRLLRDWQDQVPVEGLSPRLLP